MVKRSTRCTVKRTCRTVIGVTTSRRIRRFGLPRTISIPVCPETTDSPRTFSRGLVPLAGQVTGAGPQIENARLVVLVRARLDG